jgi:hypothetical protein
MIEQITKAEHARRIEPWHQKAVNDATVHPFLALGAWRGTPAPVDDDWNTAYFMDQHDMGLLRVGFDHVLHTGTIGLWVLEGNTGIAALLMRYAMCKLPQRYGLTHLAFCISDSNRVWRDQAMRVAGKWMWGREPGSAFDQATGKTVECLHFKVPVEAIQQRRRRRVGRLTIELEASA